MSKKPNAANLTHGLAQLGGGSKREGGSGGIRRGLEANMSEAQRRFWMHNLRYFYLFII